MFDWLLPPATLALTPQTLTLGFAALTGAATMLPPVDIWLPPPFEAELPCVDGAQLLVWVLPPRMLAFTPQTVTVALPPFTGAETSEPVPAVPVPFPLWLALCWVPFAQPLL